MADYKSAIPYIQKAEGGLSRSLTDTASQNPSPYTYNGQTGWHTNRGIQWTTFKSLAPKGGYEVSENNFIRMSDAIWLAIYRVGFWDVMMGDRYTSQPIANAVVDWGWASGTGDRGAKGALIRYLKTKGITANGYQTIADGFNELVKRQGEKKVFNDLVDERKRFFKSLNQPANEKGWLARMEELRDQGLSILGSGLEYAKKNIATTIMLILGISALTYGIILFTKNK